MKFVFPQTFQVNNTYDFMYNLMIVNQIIINMHKVLYHFQAVASSCINYCRLNCSRDREKESPELSKLGCLGPDDYSGARNTKYREYKIASIKE